MHYIVARSERQLAFVRSISIYNLILLYRVFTGKSPAGMSRDQLERWLRISFDTLLKLGYIKFNSFTIEFELGSYAVPLPWELKGITAEEYEADIYVTNISDEVDTLLEFFGVELGYEDDSDSEDESDLGDDSDSEDEVITPTSINTRESSSTRGEKKGVILELLSQKTTQR